MRRIVKPILLSSVLALSPLIGCQPPTTPRTAATNATAPAKSQAIADPFDLFSECLENLAAMEQQPASPPEGMVWIPGGVFWMGSDDGPEDERPRHRVHVSGFWMDRTEVTNAQFGKFVEATSYITVAERQPDPKKYPDADPKNLVPGSAVFVPPNGPVDLNGPPVWWQYVPGANWRHPDGPSSTISGKANHPVVQICWEDAVEYCKWAKRRLPTEAEWEFAARGGLDRCEYCWGNEKHPGGKFMANTWQGRFPAKNTGDDGFLTTAPVGSFPPNGYGLVDMAGNAWEWCSDWYDPNYYSRSPRDNPKGPDAGAGARDFDEASRVRRGGSFLCADNYCRRYLPSARDCNPPDSSANHTGFRCARD
ncbi:MAG TPA: formylglycine-generating enzyme family protein [Gemmataceae bacterium]|nr:formylglycine-generating enzyme family protein [Gemmataceae bacterium]